MNRFAFDLKMANVRTLLPVSAFGLACLWATILGVLLSDVPLSGFDEPSFITAMTLRLALLIGAAGTMLVAYVKRTLIVDDANQVLSWTGAGLFALVGALQLVVACGLNVPALLQVVVWVLAGCGYSFLYLNWPRVFMVSWQRDVGVFLAFAAALGTVFFLFAQNMLFPYNHVVLVILPLASAVVLKYTSAHIVKGTPVEEGREELTKLAPLVGFSVVLFGIIFGIALYQLMLQYASVDAELSALALVAGAGLLLAVTLFSTKYVTFGRMEKVALVICLVGSFAFAVGGAAAAIPCCLLLAATWAFFEFANYSALIGFSSSHKNPFWQIARGEVVLVAGIGIAWLFCILAQQYAPWLLDHTGIICAAIALMLTLVAALSPFPENAFADKNAYGGLSGEDALTLRCERVAKKYKLSDRESQIVPFLARGRNAQHISEQLFISVYTARTHIYHIYQKMGVSTQQELITLVESEEIEVL